jgi:hypothetical protein
MTPLFQKTELKSILALGFELNSAIIVNKYSTGQAPKFKL